MEKDSKEIVDDRYITKYEHERDKSKIYAYINEKTEKNKEKIDDIEDALTKDIYNLQREFDKNSYQLENLTTSVSQLNNAIVKLTEIFTEHSDKFNTIENRIGGTEKEIEEQKKMENKKKMDLEKLLAIIIPSLIGAGGIMNTLAELFFK